MGVFITATKSLDLGAAELISPPFSSTMTEVASPASLRVRERLGMVTYTDLCNSLCVTAPPALVFPQLLMCNPQLRELCAVFVS